MLGHPPSVHLSKIVKHRMLGANTNPSQFWFSAEVDDVGVIVLFFNGYAIILASLDNRPHIGRDRGPRPHRLGLYEYLRNNSRIRMPIDQFLEFRRFEDESA